MKIIDVVDMVFMLLAWLIGSVASLSIINNMEWDIKKATKILVSVFGIASFIVVLFCLLIDTIIVSVKTK